MQSAAPGFANCFTEVPTLGLRILSPCAKKQKSNSFRCVYNFYRF